MANKVAVVAIGGNALITDPSRISAHDQYLAVTETTRHIAKLIKEGWRVAIGHGNGPQVGFALRRSELASHELPEEPMDVCGANTQGWIGYFIQQNLRNELRAQELDSCPVTIVTQVEVDSADPAFQRPSKPIGAFMDEVAALRWKSEGWNVMEDAGCGWRRVVASPRPQRIVEEKTIRDLMEIGATVITVGGGGIPVVADSNGQLKGAAAVIDKDLSSALLANLVQADAFIISTGVEKVALNFGKPNQQWLEHLSLAEARRNLAEGTHFAKGSTAPKIEAAIAYLDRGGTHAIITDPPNISRAVAGETGTHITV